ncbi:PAS domain S-box protein [Allocoleopsis franciscana]|uniref:histidine kinase n=1 Tax=Allocoleopsis franciscana PCC 7113 TaxID=1173027 RepID=K9WJ41_9CYAN|nr:PAS domain S-box protein [Allocoleopsis franciscana]AFZ19794.1 PAS domain S-box [Allocoleopsis franciscana PCC 7113]
MKTLLFGNRAISFDQLDPYQGLEANSKAAFDDLTRLAACICQTPIALLCFIDVRRGWVQSQVGLDPNSTEAYLALCAQTLLQRERWDSRLWVIEDVLADPHWANHEGVTSQANIGFYAGVPLVMPQGLIVGILAVMDHQPRSLTLKQKKALATLSKQAISLTISGVNMQSERHKSVTSLKGRTNKRQQQKEAKPTLQQELATLKLVLECTSMVSITDHRGKINYVNDNFCKISQYSREELLGKDHRLMNSGYHSSDFFKQMWVTISRGKVWRGEIRNRAKDGNFYWVNTAIVPILNAQEKPYAYISVCQDITEHKRIENERLSPSQGGTEIFFKFSPDLMCILSGDGHFQQVNPAFEKILSYTPEQLLSQPFLDFVHPEDKVATQSVWEKLGSATENIEVENRYRCQDGSYKWQRWNFFCPVNEHLIYGIGHEVPPHKPGKATLLERSHFSTLEADVAAALGQGSPLVESLKRCTEAMVQHLDAIGVGIWLVDSASVGSGDPLPLDLQACAGTLRPANTFPAHVPPNHHLIGTIAQTRQSLNTQLFVESEEADSAPINFSGYPLMVESRLVGVIALHSRHRFSQVVHNVLGWVANTIATAIDRAWSRDEFLSRWEALLCQLANQIHNFFDLDIILNTAVTEIWRLLGVDSCHFLWCIEEAESPRLTISHEACNPELPCLLGENLPPHLKPIAEIIREQKTLKIEDLRQTGDLNAQTQSLLCNWGITAGLLLPLKTHTGQLGAIACSHYNGSRQWSDREVELLQAVVDQLAIAIEQTEMFANNRAAALAAQTQARHLELALKDLQQTETWLIQTEKMSGLGQMVAGVAHEINNPVNFITGNLSHATNYIQDLLELINYYKQHYPNPNSEIQGFIEEIDLEFLIEDLPKILSSMKMGADRIQEIVLSLRDFSRLDDAQMRPINIHEGIDSTLLILQNRLKPKGKHPGVTVIKEYGNLPPVECYAGQINQVFMNILSNAIDALENCTVEGTEQQLFRESQEDIEGHCQINTSSSTHPASTSPTIWISTELLEDNQAVIRIRDNGLGMPPSVVRRLFDPFFTTKPVGKGTGLGLSISHQIIVEKHGGLLQCYSEPGQGAEFWIQIPISSSVRTLSAGE